MIAMSMVIALFFQPFVQISFYVEETFLVKKIALHKIAVA